jgi:hypothetical protein
MRYTKNKKTDSLFFHIVAIFILLTLITSSAAISYPKDKRGFIQFFQKLYVYLFDATKAKQTVEKPIKQSYVSSKKGMNYQIMSTDTTYDRDPSEPPPPPPPPTK